MRFEASTRIRLQAGEALRLPVDRQAAIQVAHGTVVVCDVPAWIGERMIFRRALLGEGQAHRFTQAGWIEVVAQRDADVLCVAAPRPFAAWWRACLQRLTWWQRAVPRH